MKKLLSILILLCTSCAEKAHTLPSPEFWKTATLEDVDHAVTDGLDVNARDSDYKTALMFAAEYNTNPNVVEHLVKLGANVNAWGFSGETKMTITHNPDAFAKASADRQGTGVRNQFSKVWNL